MHFDQKTLYIHFTFYKINSSLYRTDAVFIHNTLNFMMKNDSNRVIERLNDGRSIKDWLVVLKWNDKKSEWMASIASKCSNFLVCIKTNFTYKGQRKTFLNLYIVKTGFRGYFGSICLKKKVFHAIHKYTSIQKHCFFFLLRTIYFQTHVVFLEIVGVKRKDQDPFCWIFFFLRK